MFWDVAATGDAIIRIVKMIISLAMIVLGTAASGTALAWRHHGHARFGVFIGAPAYWYYPAPYYPPYYPSVVTVPASPPVYVERGSAGGEPSADAYWYYCAESKAYYPYIKECPGGWQRVVPQPPPGS